MVWLGRDLKGHQVPAPAVSRDPSPGSGVPVLSNPAGNVPREPAWNHLRVDFLFFHTDQWSLFHPRITVFLCSCRQVPSLGSSAGSGQSSWNEQAVDIQVLGRGTLLHLEQEPEGTELSLGRLEQRFTRPSLQSLLCRARSKEIGFCYR